MLHLSELFPQTAMLGLAVIAAAAATAAILIVGLRPWLLRYALARPNARSSHSTPTPQGGGIAVIAATLAVTAVTTFTLRDAASPFSTTPGPVLIAAAFIALLGAVDDIRTLPVAPRLFGQALAVAVVLASLPAQFTVTSFLPWWLERGLLLIAGMWFVNLVNFMDGLDWMTVAEMLPVTGGVVVLSALAGLPMHATMLALALFGALLGFAPFNKPVARLFLGDVGSLPIGLLTGYLLLLLAGSGYVAAALLLPLYYLADATLTLLRRFGNGEKVWQAHRSHFYQRATANGFSVMHVVGRVFAVNIGLVVLAALSVWKSDWLAQVAALLLGCVIVTALLINFSRKQI
jgi:UDP-N-acetylmuramyl pentapeptide phosphotransferase/UDP-N-acetylglucosamine-1-phosphate transferase